MTEAKAKLKKVAPLMRAREAQLNMQAQKLQEIRNSKMQAIEDLRQSQKDYVAAVDTVNSQRQSSDRSMLLTLESSIDLLKSRFYQALKRVRECENQERMQLAAVVAAETNKKSAEELETRYSNLLVQETNRKEQAALDEFSLRRHAVNESEKSNKGDQ